MGAQLLVGLLFMLKLLREALYVLDCALRQVLPRPRPHAGTLEHLVARYLSRELFAFEESHLLIQSDCRGDIWHDMRAAAKTMLVCCMLLATCLQQTCKSASRGEAAAASRRFAARKPVQINTNTATATL